MLINYVSILGILKCSGEKGSFEAGKQTNHTEQWPTIHVASCYQWVTVYTRAAGVVE